MENPLVRYLPGEREAIKAVQDLGARYGYGNLIHALRDAWSAMLQQQYGMTPGDADMAAGHCCAWCAVDTRTGQPRPNPRASENISPQD